MELQKARELYKLQYGRNPSSKMKLENIIAKLNLIEGTEEEVVEPKVEKKEPQWIKVTTATRAKLLGK